MLTNLTEKVVESQLNLKMQSHNHKILEERLKILGLRRAQDKVEATCYCDVCVVVPKYCLIAS